MEDGERYLRSWMGFGAERLFGLVAKMENDVYAWFCFGEEWL